MKFESAVTSIVILKVPEKTEQGRTAGDIKDAQQTNDPRALCQILSFQFQSHDEEEMEGSLYKRGREHTQRKYARHQAQIRSHYTSLDNVHPVLSKG